MFTKYATKKLKFGYYFDDGVTVASPPVKRAVEMTAKALQAKGYEVVELVPPNIHEAVHCFVALTTYEGSSLPPSKSSLYLSVPSPVSLISFLFSVACVYNLDLVFICRYANLRKPISQDPMEPTVQFLLTLGRLPNFLRSTLAFLIQYALRDPVSAETIRLCYSKSASQMAHWVARRNTLRQQCNDWFHQQQLDAIICPTSPVPPPKINGTKMTGALATSTFLYNILEWPAGVVPVTRTEEGERMEEARWKGRERDGYSSMYLDLVYGKGKLYDDVLEGGQGLPIGVQVLIPHIPLFIKLDGD